MLKLSFILPCYNVERYIADCLNSIYAQDLPENEFEVICVNDCSTDKTREVIASVQGQHPNLVLINQSRNMYSGASRNRGLEMAKGDYIWFVDADDMVKPQVAAHLLDMAYADDLEVLLFNYDEFKDDHSDGCNKIKDLFRDTEVMGGSAFAEREFGCILSRLSLLWLRLVKRSLIERYNLRFSDLYISQDGPFAWESLLLAERVKSISERCYDYRVNSQSITADKNTAKKAAVWSFQYPTQIKSVKEKVAGAVPDGVVAWLDQSVRYEVNEFAVRYQRLPAEEKTQYYKAMRAEKGWYKKFKCCLSRKNKVVYWMGFFGEHAFSKAIKRVK
ncbi:MAG: glycosyltransferase [Bacteroidales bacterium]|nr:glycosyltransferase [Bacteroidales bacterium]